MTVEAQRALDELLERFIHPILLGGSVSPRTPIGPACAPYFREASASRSDIEEAILEAIVRAASRIAFLDQPRWPCPPLLALGAALHNLAIATDPAHRGLLKRGARETMVRWAGAWVELAGAPMTRGDVLARHALIERFDTVRRRDTELRSWARAYRFEGRPPRGLSLVTVPGLPFPPAVVDEPSIRELVEALSPEAEHTLRAARERSPLTTLLGLPGATSFRWTGATLAVLSDRALRAAVAGHLILRESSAASPLGASFTDPLLVAQPAHHALVVQLILEMHLIAALDRHTGPPPVESGPAFQQYAAVLIASLDHPQGVRELASFDDDHRRLVQRRAESLRPRVPRDLLESTRQLLDQALRAEPAYLPS